MSTGSPQRFLAWAVAVFAQSNSTAGPSPRPEVSPGARLRDARSALRRIDKLVLAASDDADAHSIAEAAQDAMGRLVNHLVRAQQQRRRDVQAAVRRVR